MGRTRPDEGIERLAELVRRYLRDPDGYAMDDQTGDPIFDFTPPLTGGEQVILDRIASIAKSHVSGITPAEWEALEPGIARVGQFRLRASQEWASLAPTQRESDVITWCRDLTDILRALIQN